MGWTHFHSGRELAAAENRRFTEDDLKAAIVDGAVLRVRPILMTVTAIIAGLLPIMFGDGTGAEVMRRIHGGRHDQRNRPGAAGSAGGVLPMAESVAATACRQDIAVSRQC